MSDLDFCVVVADSPFMKTQKSGPDPLSIEEVSRAPDLRKTGLI
jgi:hypothetical protein